MKLTDKIKTSSRGPQEGSMTSWLIELKLTERRYIETSADEYKKMMNLIQSTKCRMPEYLKSMDWSVSLFTAISAGDFRDIRYLICVERTK